MFRRISRKRAQSTLEYAILIGVVVAGLIAMQVYVKRGYQGKLKESADSMGDQFSPGYTTYTEVNESSSTTNEDFKNGVSTTEIQSSNNTRDVTDEKVAAFDQENWWTKSNQ